jgi:hypothetical protein
LILHAEILAAVANQLVHFFKGAFVKQKFNSLARGQFSFRVLSRFALGTPTGFSGVMTAANFIQSGVHLRKVSGIGCLTIKVMLSVAPAAGPLRLAREESARLIAVVDTEEEFDWTAPHSRRANSVSNIAHVGRMQRVFDAHGICPIYVVDYPIATQEAGWRPLKEFAESKSAEIGAHLHPWVNPPDEEELNLKNSYHGNLPKTLERSKIQALTQVIENSFQLRPTVFKAGRYGLGPNTRELLHESGYTIDLSPSPPFDYRRDEGPDFSAVPCDPFWDPTGMLVLPGSGDVYGWWPGNLRGLHSLIDTPLFRQLRAEGILSRLGAATRCRLSPEGFSLEEMIRLTQFLYAKGLRVFVLSLHSPSVMIGGTPYSKSERDIEILLERLNGYFAFFKGAFGGHAWTTSAALSYFAPVGG